MPRFLAVVAACLCSGAVALAQDAAPEAASPTPPSDPSPPATAAVPPPSSVMPADVEEKPRSGWAALPILTYAPETRLGFGGFATHFFRITRGSAEQTRPSSLTAVALYTLRDQTILELIPELYWNEDRGHLWSRVDFRHYPNRVWSTGPDAPDDSEEGYTEVRPRWQLRAGHAVWERLFAYGHLEALHMEIEDAAPGGLLETGAVPGADGGAVVGVGPGLAWDTRDHLLVPRRGFFHEVILMTRQPFAGSAYTFTDLTLNLRHFVTVVDDQVLALNLFGQLQWGEVPFFNLAQLGGQRLLRGYFEGRLRDRTLLAIQAEYRFPIYWRFGGVVHAATGDVAPSLDEFPIGSPEWSVGTGLRIMLNRDEKLNLRADLGFGRDTWGLYVSAAEAF